MLSRQMGDGTEVKTRGTVPREFRLSRGGELSVEQAAGLADALERFVPGGDRALREVA
jgi:hypothetical protein